jgi:hypothetical protein
MFGLVSKARVSAGIGAVIAIGAFAFASTSGEATTAPQDHWVASWVGSPQAPGPADAIGSAGFDDQTVRNVVAGATGGSMVRVQVTNTFGSARS